MTQKDWFEVGIRIIGVYLLFMAVVYFAESALMYTDYSRNPDINFRYYMIFGWIYGLGGLILLKAPGIFTNFAYPEEPEVEDEKEEAPREEDNAEK